jgi:hypothetical protein
MKAKDKWTDVSFNDHLKQSHDLLPKGNTCPTSIEEARKIMGPFDLPHVSMIASFIVPTMQRRPNVRCATWIDTREGRKLLKKWYGTFRSFPVCSDTSRTTRKQN